jgi:hypothetical protein
MEKFAWELADLTLIESNLIAWKRKSKFYKTLIIIIIIIIITTQNIMVKTVFTTCKLY